MKPRPPTMRIKKRYVLAAIVPNYPSIDSKVLYVAIAEAITGLYGDGAGAALHHAVVFAGDGYLIARCSRGSEQFLATALAVVTEVDGQRVAFRTLATSGTIHALRRRMRQPVERPEREDLEVDGVIYEVHVRESQKVDLIEKGCNSQKLLFLVEQDLQER
ncbi:Rpp14/Pop5 family protein [Methanosphaerula palustris]|uniref:Ribonuclease P protein component 2 n=1 Tax=Methanosphaerula palustris (strain ATCC BAA-1556 / DSM 19958 / E1-9c) TaxID=521011 RepID=RNP2_METPE|nr:Rpp14/Pop5 family protein [Methanosphaerula palustris]B8GEZ4.1 RecName: Full=Ribonuclease P protein component 2; Short=RNase P component 2; AltName: Full=Pop5 [Methanosphaerula palustris E1-9c]ACL17800.1 ribonuclease P-related protein [Methanosphaerula palustris E1-9c]